MTTLFEQVGEDALRGTLVDFYERVFADVMIGYLFAGKDKERLIQKEYELTAELLGAEVTYTGRTMHEAHKDAHILGGHFDRRLQILRETLADHHILPAAQALWIEHSLLLRDQVTALGPGECDDPVARKP